MVSDCHAYTTSLMRYLKGEWAAKKIGKLPDADNGILSVMWTFFASEKWL